MSVISDIDRRHMDELTAGVETKSDKIRRLDEAGYKRADIARYLGIRYQFVYNVLTQPRPAQGRAAKRAGGREVSLGAARQTKGADAASAPAWSWAAVGKGGVVELPASFLAALGVEEGDHVQLSCVGNTVRILGRQAALRELQEQVRSYLPEGVSLVDELLAERKAEATRETGDRSGG